MQLLNDHWGDLASAAGLAVALYGIWKTYGAAQRAEKAAHRVRAQMQHVDTVAALATVATAMREVMSLHRAGYWAVLPDRYQTVREQLATIRSGAPGLSAHQRQDIQAAIGHLGAMERSLGARLAGVEGPDIVEWNAIIGEQILRLVDLLTAIKSSGAEEP